MIINLEEVAKFVRAMPGDGLMLDSDKRRVVRLELNAETPAALQLQTGAADMRFLAAIPEGRHTLTFIADGPVTIWPTAEGELWWWCPEMEGTAVTVEDPVIFTRIVERKPRNVELERIAAKMQENADRRMAMLMGQVSEVVGQLRTENETLKAEKKTRERKPKPAPAADDAAGGKSDGDGASGASGDAGQSGGDAGQGGGSDGT